MTESDEEPTLADGSLPPPSLPPSLMPSVPASAAPEISGTPADSHTSMHSLTTSLAVMEEQRVKNQAILWMGLVGGSSAAGLVQIPDPAPGRLAITIALVVEALACGFVLFYTRRGHPAQSRMLLAVSIGMVLTVLIGCYHVGVFSPVVMVLVFGVFFYGLVDSALHAWTIFIEAVGGYFVLGALAVAGVIDLSVALLPVTNTKPSSLAVLTIFLVLMLSMTFWLARVSRRATLRAMTQLESARRQIHHGRALLNEARADLDQALGATGLGRLTGHMLGPYHADSVIGRGATGEVYAAIDTRDGKDVAIKALYPHVSESEGAIKRFMREAQITSALQSPHIVRIYDSGNAEDGSPYLVMERLLGHDLSWHLRTARRLTAHATIELVTQVANALAAAQDAGVVHRDLKPQNLIAVDHDGARTWKVLDFGVSKINLSSSSLTQDAAIGTPSYMAPEQARGQAIDHRVDVFALGVIAYRVLTGRPAFTGKDTFATIYNVAYVQPVRPSEHALLHPDVDLVLALALAKNKKRRFSSAPSFSAALREAMRGELDPRLRQDALELLEAEPWGSDLGGRPQESPKKKKPAGADARAGRRP